MTYLYSQSYISNWNTKDGREILTLLTLHILCVCLSRLTMLKPISNNFFHSYLIIFSHKLGRSQIFNTKIATKTCSIGRGLKFALIYQGQHNQYLIHQTNNLETFCKMFGILKVKAKLRFLCVYKRFVLHFSATSTFICRYCKRKQNS